MKKKLADVAEELDAMGKESEVEAAKWVIEKGNEETKKMKDQKYEEQEKLTGKRKFLKVQGKKDPYKEELVILAKVKMIDSRDEIPKGYQWDVQVTGKGIMVGIKRPDGKIFGRGMIVSGFPEFDQRGISSLVFSALDQIGKWEGEKGQSSGIVLL